MARFEELGLSDSILCGLKDMGFSEPTPVQSLIIPLLFEGKDVICQSKTGTGKTAAFGIYVLEGIDYEVRKPQVLILTPTRELCLQVRDEVARIGRHTKVNMAPVYGGQDIEKQFRLIRGGANVVVGTPGRIIDHLKRKTLSFSDVGLVVIDEADRMLDMGFIDDVQFILANTPKDRQTLLFSATIAREIRELADKYMHSPEFLNVSRDETPVVTHIKQQFTAVRDPRDRLYALLGYLRDEKPSLGIIFCRTKFGADKLKTILNDRGFACEALHGDLSQSKREQVMGLFRKGKVNLLIATDLAARGLDVDDVSHVINYNVPEDFTTYVHRVGRTGRMGKAGSAYSIVMQDEMGKLGEIERSISVRMEEVKFEAPVRPEGPRCFSHGAPGGFRHGGHQRSHGPERGFGPRGERRQQNRGDRRGPSRQEGGRAGHGAFGGQRRAGGYSGGGSHGAGRGEQGGQRPVHHVGQRLSRDKTDGKPERTGGALVPSKGKPPE